MKKIKSVSRNGIPYFREGDCMWTSHKVVTNVSMYNGGYIESVHEDVIQACELYDIEYESIPWRAKMCCEYYKITYGLNMAVMKEYEQGTVGNTADYHLGNYFKTEECALKALDAIKAIFKTNRTANQKCV